MKELKKIFFISGFFAVGTLSSGAAIGISRPMKGPAPKADDVGEILFRYSDRKGEILGRDGILNLMRKGTFITVSLEDYPHQLPVELRRAAIGELKHYIGGCFATKEGKVFEFNPWNSRILEIQSVDGVGYFIVRDEGKKSD